MYFTKAQEEKAAKSPLWFPGKALADARGNRLFIADSTHHRIVVTDLSGKQLYVAGTGKAGRDDGAFERSSFNDPQGMALDGDLLYLADRKNHLIRAPGSEEADRSHHRRTRSARARTFATAARACAPASTVRGTCCSITGSYTSPWPGTIKSG